MPKKPEPTTTAEDLALVVGASEDQRALAILRKRGDEVSAGLLRRAEEGMPIHGELVRLRPREDPHLFDVETLYAPPTSDAPALPATTAAISAPAADTPTAADQGAVGPAQVATPDYRAGWARTFAAARKRRSDN